MLSWAGNDQFLFILPIRKMSFLMAKSSSKLRRPKEAKKEETNDSEKRRKIRDIETHKLFEHFFLPYRFLDGKNRVEKKMFPEATISMDQETASQKRPLLYADDADAFSTSLTQNDASSFLRVTHTHTRRSAQRSIIYTYILLYYMFLSFYLAQKSFHSTPDLIMA